MPRATSRGSISSKIKSFHKYKSNVWNPWIENWFAPLQKLRPDVNHDLTRPIQGPSALETKERFWALFEQATILSLTDPDRSDRCWNCACLGVWTRSVKKHHNYNQDLEENDQFSKWWPISNDAAKISPSRVFHKFLGSRKIITVIIPKT